MERNEFVLIEGRDYQEMTKKILRAIDLSSMIGDRQKKVALKPNLVSDSPANEGATTHPEIVSGVIEYLQENGFRNISVMEGSWVGSRTASVAHVNGLDKVVKKYQVPFYDLQKDSFTVMKANGLEMEVCDRALEPDFLISLPVLKGHMQTLVTCALKNMKGLITNNEKRKFHRMGLHRPIAALNTILHPDLILVDHICGDPDCEDGGNPEIHNTIFACLDPVLCDAYACQELGYSVDQIEYIGLAERCGAGSSDLTKAVFTRLGSGKTEKSRKDHRTTELRKYINEDSACSACYGMLMEGLLSLSDEELSRLPGPVSIGQGFRGKSGDIGFGNCTSGFGKCLHGCPPSEKDAADFLKELCRR